MKGEWHQPILRTAGETSRCLFNCEIHFFKAKLNGILVLKLRRNLDQRQIACPV